MFVLYIEFPPKYSRPPLRSAHSSIQWVPSFSPSGAVAWATTFHILPRLKKEWIWTSPYPICPQRILSEGGLCEWSCVGWNRVAQTCSVNASAYVHQHQQVAADIFLEKHSRSCLGSRCCQLPQQFSNRQRLATCTWIKKHDARWKEWTVKNGS
jgi:hypothetical protein